MKSMLLALVGLAMSAGVLIDADEETLEVEQWPPAGADEIAPPEPTLSQMVMTIRGAAQRHGISPRLLEAMAVVESNLDPNAVSRAGAIGILQVVPHSAGREVYRLRGRPGQPTPEALTQPEYNAEIAAEYLAWLKGYFGQEAPPEVVVAAFNAGPSRVNRCLEQGRSWRACLPLETREYLSRVDRAVGGLRWQT